MSETPLTSSIRTIKKRRVASTCLRFVSDAIISFARLKIEPRRAAGFAASTNTFDYL
jgi:hypothetical protein